MRSHHIIECVALLALATGCTPERARRAPVQARAVAGTTTVTSRVALGVPVTMDTFAVITDSSAAAAQATGTMLPRITAHFDAGIVAKRGDDVCYRYPRYTVVQRHIVDGSSYDLLVRRAAANAPPQQRCVVDSLPGDFVIREQDGVLGMRGDTLWAESGEMMSDLALYDVAGREKLMEMAGYEIAEWRDDATVAIWLWAAKATHSDCPTVPKGLYPARDSLYLLHLASLRLEPAGAARCVATQ